MIYFNDDFTTFEKPTMKKKMKMAHYSYVEKTARLNVKRLPAHGEVFVYINKKWSLVL